ncbi:MAG: translation initiation factor IF-6 [Candidatus Woesearchaeota archaeon]
MGTIKIDFNGNQNIGLFSYSNDEITLIGTGYGYDKNKDRIEKALKTRLYEVNITGISLVGVMITGYKNKILVPSDTFDNEIETLKELGFEVKRLNTKYNALRNNIIVFKNGVLVKKDLEREAEEEIKKFFNKKVLRTDFDQFEAIGQMFAKNDHGIIASPQLKEEDKEIIEKFLEQKIRIGTINFGGSYINSGVVANNNGLLVGKDSSGYEIVEIESGLGFTKYD